MSEQRRYLAQEAHADLRLDQALVMLCPHWSRRMLKRAIRQGQVRVNGKLASASYQVQKGDELGLLLPDQAPSPAPSILHESPNFLYVHKPSGLHVVAQYPRQPHTLATQLREHHPHCVAASEDPRDGGAIHRLDAGTSGVIAVAKTRAAYQAGRHAMQTRSACKYYLAAVDPVVRVRSVHVTLSRAPGFDLNAQKDDQLRRCFPNLTRPFAASGALEICSPLARGPDPSRVVIAGKGSACRAQMMPLGRMPLDQPPGPVPLGQLPGRMLLEQPPGPMPLGQLPGRTPLEQPPGRMSREQPPGPMPLGQLPGRTPLDPPGRVPLGPPGRLRRLVHLRLITGMRHQLRVQLAAIGCPIAHDPQYGARTSPALRLALHAWSLDLRDADPHCGPVLAPIPSDFVHAAQHGP